MQPVKDWEVIATNLTRERWDWGCIVSTCYGGSIPHTHSFTYEMRRNQVQKNSDENTCSG